MRTTRLVGFLGCVTLGLAALVGAVAAQEQANDGYVAVVNGASTDPVDVAVGDVATVEALAYAADGVGTIVPSGPVPVAFTGGTVESDVLLDIAPGEAFTVVSGFGEEDATAAAYEIDVSPIDDGLARITLWNATTEPVLAAIGSVDPVELAPGEGTETLDVPGGAEVAVTLGDLESTIAASADSYTDVFHVDDGAEPMIAASVVASMSDLIVTLYGDADDAVEVPDVAGLNPEAAVEALEAAGFSTEQLERPSDDVDEGLVVKTIPAAGIEIPTRVPVVIVVSSGPEAEPEPELVEVPDVAGLPQEDATVELEDLGFVVELREETNADAAAGTAFGTIPEPGTAAESGATVTLLVSSGPATVAVPDVAGQDVDAARAILEAAGFTVVIEEENDEADAGVVLASNPSAGIDVAPGSTVTLTVSLGPPDVRVPPLEGLSIEEAQEAAEARGLEVSFREDQDAPDPNGVVVDQTPEPDEPVPPGTEIVAQLSPAIPDAWATLSLNANRILRVTGINFVPGSRVDLELVGTNLFDAATVDADGVWVLVYDLDGVDLPERHLLVTGTAADGNSYSRTFVIPTPGGVSDEPLDEDPTAWWLWAILIAAIAGIAVLVWWFASRARGVPAPPLGSPMVAAPASGTEPDAEAAEVASPWRQSFAPSEGVSPEPASELGLAAGGDDAGQSSDDEEAGDADGDQTEPA